MERGIRFIGNGQAPVHKYWEQLLQMIEDGKLNPLDMVSHRVSVDELDTIYEIFDKHGEGEGMQKTFVETRFSDPPAPGSPQLTRYKK